ncbi:MAG TPA: two-component regulator propeller domain-containing protein [Pirellulales bacterium]
MTALLVVLAISTIVPGRPALALDPNRSLSQAFHRVWQVPQGLPQATINTILQSSDGYLWLGTPAGLIRFDGVRFTTIADCAGIAPQKLWIHDLCEDHASHLWIATDGVGLIRFRGEQALHYTRENGLPSDTVRCVLVARDGTTWAGTDDGLAHLSNHIEVHGSDRGLLLKDVHALSQASDATIWAGGIGHAIYSFDGSQWNTHELATLPQQTIVRTLSCAEDGTIWVGTSAGLVRYKDGQETLYTENEGLAGDSVYCLARGSDDSLWVGTREGFSRVYGDEITSFGATDGLSQSNVYAICEDREASLWVGTKHGLNQFNDRRTVPFTMREGLPGNNIGPLCNGADGSLWVGTLGSGLARFDGRRFTTLTTADGLASNSIQSLARDTKDRIWAGTQHGLNCLEGGRVTRTYTEAEGLPSSVVTCVCPVPEGSLWVGTPAGIAELQGDRFVRPAEDSLAVRLPVQTLFAQEDGSLLIATTSGVYRYFDVQVAPFTASQVADKDVASIFQDSSQHLFLGTQGNGLFIVGDRRVANVTMRQGLLDDDIAGILADDDDRLWMASGSGLSYTQRIDLLNFAAGKTKTLTTTPFRLSDGTRSYEVQEGVQPCIMKSSDGRIWQSTTRGLMMVDPTRLKRVLPPTPVVIEEVIVNGQPREPDQIHKLRPGSSNLAFEYTALSLVVPMRITFRYKLEGFDNDWIDAGSRREAFYTNLPPGQYQFRVVARNVDENDWETAQPVTFTIQPHFYQTFWFLPLCALALGLAGFGAYRLRVRTIKEQMRAVVAERSRIARELHDTLMQGFSGVTMEMQALAARLQRSNERSTLEEIIRDAANCVRDARRSVAGLRHDPAAESGLSSAIAQAARQLTETREVRLKLNMRNCPLRLPVDVEYNLLRIAQEAIANAVKHSGARSIDVSLDGSGRKIILIVEDDGSGFASPAGTRAGHYGIIGMRERAKQISAHLSIDSEPGFGTTVRVAMAMPDIPRAAEPPARLPTTEEITPS